MKTRLLLTIAIGCVPAAPVMAADRAADPGWGDAPAQRNGIRLVQPATMAPASASAAIGNAASAPDASHSRRRATAAKRRHPVQPAHEAKANEAQCTGLPAQWARAHALADAGGSAPATALYRDLLHRCDSPQEREGTAWQAAKALPSDALDRLLEDPVFDTAGMNKVRTGIRLQRMYDENTAGRYASALVFSRQLRADATVELDAPALEVSGWLEERAHDDAAAERLFRKALQRTSDRGDPESARFGLALSLMHQQRLDEAESQASLLTKPEGKRLRATIALARAKASHDARQVDAAIALADESGALEAPSTRALEGWALLDSGRPTQAEKIFEGLHAETPDNAEYRQGLAYAAAANRDYPALQSLVDADPAHTPPIAREALAAHDERRGLFDRARAVTSHISEGQEPALQSLVSLDRKSGTAGQDKLEVWTIPQLSLSLLPTPTLSLHIDAAALRLDDGVRHAWGKTLGASLGTELGDGVLTAGAAVEEPGSGSTQLLGKLQYQRIAEQENAFARITVSRDSIYDSLRAYEGVASGPGPAVSTSIELTGRDSIDGSAFYLGGTIAGGVVTASGTVDNPFYAASIALTRDFAAKGWSWLNAGPELRVSSYRYDANRFDGPYAGYWSPKSNREAGLVFNAQSDEGGRFLFKTGGRVGYAQRELFTGRASGAFGEDTTTAAVLLARHLIVGAGVGYRASPGYRDMSLFAWMKIPLEPRGHLHALDLVTPRGF